jgi:hypothetical protein
LSNGGTGGSTGTGTVLPATGATGATAHYHHQRGLRDVGMWYFIELSDYFCIRLRDFFSFGWRRCRSDFFWSKLRDFFSFGRRRGRRGSGRSRG